MSTKNQILNEKQVEHFVEDLLPKLKEKFNAKANELKELAKKEIGNFATHAEVIALTEKQTKKLKESKTLVELQKKLKEVDEDFTIRSHSYRYIVATEEELENLIKEQTQTMDNLLERLSHEKLNVNELWRREQTMIDELKARLSMTAIKSYNEIKEEILNSINVNNFFTNKIAE